MKALCERWEALQEHIASICHRLGRDPQTVRVVAVTKGVLVEQICSAYALGIRDFGENYWQEARTKLDMLPADVRWHFIGHLQSNKVKYLVGQFALIQTVDRVSLVEMIQQVASKRGVVQPVLLEVRLSEAPSRAGVPPSEALALAEHVLSAPNLHLQGMMGMAPYTDDTQVIRKAFQTLRGLYEQLPPENRIWLSMGMSHDYEIALEEGSTMLRIGTALFGERS